MATYWLTRMCAFLIFAYGVGVTIHRGEESSAFEQFVATFDRKYTTLEERAHRAKVFEDNQQRMVALQKSDARATFSMLTRWADMTEEEFAYSHGLKLSSHAETPCQWRDPNGKVPKLSPTKPPLRNGLDYVHLGATVPVKDQGKCGSCWAHATTAVVEARLKLDTANITSLSEQYLLDCDKSRACKGCCGGLPEDALQWLAGDSSVAGTGKGMASEADYPYTSASGTDPTKHHCNHDAPLVAKLTGFGVLQEPVLSAHIVSAATEYGVLSSAMDSRVLQFYTGGIITNGSVCEDTNHVVAIVGYSTPTNTTGGSETVDYYKVRNSYGTAFGEEGYFRISPEAAELCGMHGCVVAATGAVLL